MKIKQLVSLNMPALTTEGIVLKHANYGEADRMLTVLTPFKGKILVVAKGVRRITSRRAGNVEPLNRVRIHLFQSQGAPILTEAQSLQTFSKIKDDLTLSAYGSHIAEITERLTAENQPNLGVYQLMVTVLELLEKNPRQIFIRAYEVKLLTVLGFWSLGQIQASRATKELLDQLQKESWSEIAEIKVNETQALDLEMVLRYYLERVLESPLKSIRVLEDLKK